MRYVIFGAGAIGGLIGGGLHLSGHDVMLIARGAHLDAIQREGLTLLTPDSRRTLRIPVAASVAQVGLRTDDTILLCVKSQDTEGALRDLRDAAGEGEPAVVCMQNGVANERAALRLFANVYGAVLLVPAEHLRPGVVAGYGSRSAGRIDIGRYPQGTDALASRIAADLGGWRFQAATQERIMVHKYAKLINNLANGVEAICGPGQQAGPNAALIERAREEGRTVLRAAGIEFEVAHVADVAGRWQEIGIGEIEGQAHRGGSGWQSVQRGAGSIETDHLNGEIVLLGRELGIATPVNAEIQSLARATLRIGRQPGWLTPEAVLARADGRSTGGDG